MGLATLRRYNTLVGWNAAHVYDKPGRYNITLRLTDETGAVTTLVTPIEVTADSFRSCIYVSATGDDGHTGLAPDQAIRSVARVQKIATDGTEILFHAGDNARRRRRNFFVNAGNVVLGAYGLDPEKSGHDRPRLTFPGSKNGWMIRMQPGKSADVIVQDLSFDSAIVPDNVVCSGIKLGGPNVVVRRCDFLNVNTAISGAGITAFATAPCRTTSPLITGLHANFLWGEGRLRRARKHLWPIPPTNIAS